MDSSVEHAPQMKTIRIVLKADLLTATDKAALRTKRYRSALVREALREHRKRLEVRGLEERDRSGYARADGTG